MSTKNDKHSFIEQSFTTSENQYYNINVNEYEKCPILIPVQSNSKPNNDKYYVSHNYEEKGKLQLWNKPFKASSFATLNENNYDSKKRWRNENSLKCTNKSTLSLHIAAYENPVASDLFGTENIAGLKKEKFGSIKKRCFVDSLKSRNPFEFPRQQNGDQRNKPEVVQFKSSQRLHNPNAKKKAFNFEEFQMADWLSGGAGSIADMVAAAANEVMVDNYLPGYIYIEAYQAYYNAESNLYYYPQNGLFYDIAKACYLKYNQFTGRYEPYVQIRKKAHWSKKRYKWKAVETYGKKTLETFDQGAVDVIETVYDLVDRVSFLAGDDKDAEKRYEKKFASSNVKYDEELGAFIDSSKRSPEYYSNGRDDGSDPETDDDGEAAEYERRKREDREAQNPPCIRIIETHNAFKFHILTIDGGTIGCARHCTVQIPDEGAIDEEHIQIFYDHQNSTDNITKGFWLRNLSRHAILVNETVVTRKKTLEINHGDIMLIGDNRLVFHIHKGMNTCNECEPGILAKEAEKQAAELKQTKRTSETARREFMTSMKRKYGLDRGQHASASNGSGEYSDRAKVRRKLVGSEIDLPSRSKTGGGTYDECVARPTPGGGTGLVDTVELKAKPKRSAPTPISEENKGFKLLKLAGWSEGKGLGKSGQGTIDPLATQLKSDRTGIGHEQPASTKSAPKTAKQRILEKTRQRFEGQL